MANSGLQEVFEAVRSRDLLSVIQLYAEGVELLQSLPDPSKVGWHFFLDVRRVREEVTFCCLLSTSSAFCR